MYIAKNTVHKSSQFKFTATMARAFGRGRPKSSEASSTTPATPKPPTPKVEPY